MGLTRAASTAMLVLLISLPAFGWGAGVSAQVAETGSREASRAAISQEALSILSETQRVLVEARDLAAKLDEPGALRGLLAAERSLHEILHVPFVHAWLAEVWLQMALVAAQRGELDLADSLFARALSLDPARRVGAAEAAPPVIARSEAVARTRDAAQRSRFRIEPSPASATSWIDGRLLGTGPTEVDLAPGPHLLLLEAKGHRSHGTLIEALPGTRRPFVFALAREAQTIAEHEPVRPAVLATRSDAHSLAPAPAHAIAAKPRWWKRWPVWLSAASVAVAGGIAVGFATREERTVERRTLTIDPGASEP